MAAVLVGVTFFFLLLFLFGVVAPIICAYKLGERKHRNGWVWGLS